MIYAIVLFILAGLAEIGGGYLLREGKSFYWGIFGGIALALYGVIATFQSFPSFDRVYAAFGGYLLFFQYCGDGELIKKHLIYMIGCAGICLVGVSIGTSPKRR